MQIRDQLEREMFDRPAFAPKPQAVEVTPDELMQLRQDREAFLSGFLEMPTALGGDVKCMGVPLCVVDKPGQHRIKPAPEVVPTRPRMGPADGTSAYEAQAVQVQAFLRNVDAATPEAEDQIIGLFATDPTYSRAAIMDGVGRWRTERHAGL